MKCHDFCVGDVVTLRSGGPQMIVKKLKVEESGCKVVYCEWFTNNEAAVSGYDFVPETLDLVSKYS